MDHLSYILGLHLTPKVVGKSLGKIVIDLIMEKIMLRKVSQVSPESTTTARDLYRKVSFVEQSPEKAIEINGTPIRCYPMKLEL